MRGIRKTGRRLAAALAAAVMMLPGIAQGGSIDRMISLLASPAEEGIEIRVQAEAVRVPELSGTRTEWLNRLLSHITIILRMSGDAQEEIIEVDGTEALCCTSRVTGERSETVFSVDSGKAYTAATPTDLLGDMSGIVPEENRTEYYSGIAVLLPEFYTFFGGLADAFPDESSMTKANVKFKDYGTATRRWALSFGDDVLQSEKMREYLSQEGLEHVRAFLAGVTLSGRQRLTLLTDDEGHLMKVNYTGKAGLSAEDMRNVNLDWRCTRSDTGSRDELQLTPPAVKGSGKNNLTVKQEMLSGEDGTQTYTCSAETDVVVDRVRTRYILDISLTGTETAVSGEIREKTIAGTSTGLVTVRADLTQTAQEEYSGSIEIIHELDKIEGEHYRLRIAAGPCGEIAWNAGAAGPMTEEAKAALTEKMAGAFLRALIPVPEEDLQYILADLPDGWWAELVRKTEKTEEIPLP